MVDNQALTLFMEEQSLIFHNFHFPLYDLCSLTDEDLPFSLSRFLVSHDIWAKHADKSTTVTLKYNGPYTLHGSCISWY